MQEEEQTSTQTGFRKTSRLSVGLSFFVAVFAIVSLIAVGFNNLSFAAPTVGDNFLFKQAEIDGDPFYVTAKSGNDVFNVPLYLGTSSDFAGTSGIPIFCVEQKADINVAGSAQYAKGSNVDDIGLLYILNKSGSLGGSGITTGIDVGQQQNADLTKKAVEAYATQVAIWVYMYEKYYLSDPTTYAIHSLERNNISAEVNYATLKNANTLQFPSLDFSDVVLTGSIYSTYISPVVQAAKAYTGVKSLSVSKANNTISKVGDDGWYQSSMITVAADPSNDLKSFTVTLSGVEGAVVVDKQGNEKSTFTVNSGEDLNFFVRVPTNKVSQTSSKVTVTVKGLFDNYLSGSYYTSDNLQKVVTVTGSQNYESANLVIDFIVAPNTGLSKAQTIYFIGLIVLLCGVGIIYANAKPVQIEE